MMNIDQDFIRTTVLSFHRSLMRNGFLCDHSEFLPLNDNYDDEVYQKIYALKYLPAYYFEYCILANLLLKRLNNNNVTDINIASMGCGLYPDYFALLHNLTGINFNYYGYDVCHWKTRQLLPQGKDNLYLTSRAVNQISSKTLGKFDVFIFPKSLKDIEQSSDIQQLAHDIIKTKKNKLYFLNSYINTSFEQSSTHVGIFKIIHDALINNGFSTIDKHNVTQYMGNAGQGLKALDIHFEYPQECLMLCLEKDDSCKCKITDNPILTNRYLDYQILEYSR
ncbi:hypothetical protein [Citrobacter amalonaticus]|uniref:hypothetical protein n=1 Tax=Citrobacter amalonaticus TaxID=35703 RepID=UPI0005C533C0|nr:hypothetical protein [Citrobacter amalonaticus]QDK85101.1 hypothetical protein FEO47_06195 [Citrobacter amalonaticus]